MTKADFVKVVAEKAGCSNKAADTAVDAVFEAVADVLKAGDKIRINNFGSFEVKETAPRHGINPATGEKIDIAASKKVVFKVSNALKNDVK